MVYAAQDRVLIELPAQMTAKTLETLDHFLISEKAEFEAVDDAFAILVAAGPGGRALLEGLRRGHARSRARTPTSRSRWAARPVRRDQPRGGPGVPASTAGPRPRARSRCGARAIAAGAVPRGLPPSRSCASRRAALYPQDVDQSVILPETRLEALVSYTKGCYIGQETVARVKYRGHVNRALERPGARGRRVPDAGRARSWRGRGVGSVTSAVRSIALGRPIALGYVRREHFEPGTAVTVSQRTAARSVGAG